MEIVLRSLLGSQQGQCGLCGSICSRYGPGAALSHLVLSSLVGVRFAFAEFWQQRRSLQPSGVLLGTSGGGSGAFSVLSSGPFQPYAAAVQLYSACSHAPRSFAPQQAKAPKLRLGGACLLVQVASLSHVSAGLFSSFFPYYQKFPKFPSSPLGQHNVVLRVDVPLLLVL